MLSGLAGDAGPGSVLRDASTARLGVLDRDALGEIELLSAVRFVGRATSELDPRDEGVVIDEVLADQRLESGEGVELMEVEPSMAELTPKGFDHGVGLDDVYLDNHVVGSWS